MGKGILIRVYTQRFLGSSFMAERLLAHMVSFKRFSPSRWEDDERARRSFSEEAWPSVLNVWTEVDAKTLFFARSKPFSVEHIVKTGMFRNPILNSVQVEFDSRLATGESFGHIVAYYHQLWSTVEGVYGIIADRSSWTNQMAYFGPERRLAGVYWANTFGQPYIDQSYRELGEDFFERRDQRKTLPAWLDVWKP